ncbi:MAG TPA: anthranilate phosphoribosyltransferase, partial [Candidatus Polarisedimenticolia bacterium]|nr:anthranilate phosphoribosyltransferase [Candidatus Polarisedimenticolia bacterium]
VGEIAAFARVMRERATRIRSDRPIVLDTCGTGGDGAGTFNISTLAAIVAAACGVTVAKHGNRSVSSRCGSADLLQGLGVPIDLPAPAVEGSLRQIGIGFLFAPTLHGAMKHAAPVRRDLGVRTVFNLLGPLTNPAQARYQLLGVYDPAWLVRMAEVLRDLGSERAMVVHGGGLDEIALHAETQVAELSGGIVQTTTLKPEDAGLGRAPLEAIRGGDPEMNVAIAREILRGVGGPRRDVVLLNTAAALVVAGRASTLREGAALAAGAIDSGAAAGVLERLRELRAGQEGRA